jgi:hypothetical protein
MKRGQVLLTYAELQRLIGRVAQIHDAEVSAVLDDPQCRLVKIQLAGVGEDVGDGHEPPVLGHIR